MSRAGLLNPFDSPLVIALIDAMARLARILATLALTAVLGCASDAPQPSLAGYYAAVDHFDFPGCSGDGEFVLDGTDVGIGCTGCDDPNHISVVDVQGVLARMNEEPLDLYIDRLVQEDDVWVGREFTAQRCYEYCPGVTGPDCTDNCPIDAGCTLRLRESVLAWDGSRTVTIDVRELRHDVAVEDCASSLGPTLRAEFTCEGHQTYRLEKFYP